MVKHVAALGLVLVFGCAEVVGGTGGSGGTGGTGGTGGSGGMAGSGGVGGATECKSDNDCEDDHNECTEDCNVEAGVCDYSPVGGDISCGGGAGTCQAGVCEFPCTEQGIRDAIAVGGGLYTFACDGTKPVTTQAEIVIDNDVILDGEGNLTVQGSQERSGFHRVFSIEAGVTAELRGMTIMGGGLAVQDANNVYGAGIFNEGTLTLKSSSVVANEEVGSSACCTNGGGNLSGAGIYSAGTLTLEDSNVSENFTWGEGSGIYNAGELEVRTSVISENTAVFSTSFGGTGIYNTGSATVADTRIEANGGGAKGGGIYNEAGGVMSVTRSTLFNNSSDGTIGGGGIYNGGTLTLANSTVSNSSFGGEISCNGAATVINTTISGGGFPNGIVLGSGALRLINDTVVHSSSSYPGIDFSGDLYAKNSLIVGKVDSPDICTSPIISQGRNIESPSDTCGLDTSKGDQVDVTETQLNLGPLQDNGGPTMTHALEALPTPSVAIDKILQADCVDADGRPLTTDQRGEPRPETGGSLCDVGAFELQ